MYDAEDNIKSVKFTADIDIKGDVTNIRILFDIGPNPGFVEFTQKVCSGNKLCDTRVNGDFDLCSEKQIGAIMDTRNILINNFLKNNI